MTHPPAATDPDPLGPLAGGTLPPGLGLAPRRCKAWRHASRLALLGAAAAAPALATAGDLGLDYLRLSAQAELGLNFRDPSPLHPGQTITVVSGASTLHNDQGILPPTVLAGTVADPWHLSLAAVQLANTGYFREQLSVLNDYPPAAKHYIAAQVPMHVDGRTSTLYTVGVSAASPDAPLQLGLHFYGAHVKVSDYYGLGTYHLSLDLQIQIMRDLPILSYLTVPEVPWRFHVDMDYDALHGGSAWQVGVTGVDLLGVGKPQVRSNPGLSFFTSTFDLTIDPFDAMLDFGLLQPGHYFDLQYASSLGASGDIPYSGPESVLAMDLADPLVLGGAGAAPPVALAGLVLPAPVPEPGSAALLVAGFAMLALRGRARTRDGLSMLVAV